MDTSVCWALSSLEDSLLLLLYCLVMNMMLMYCGLSGRCRQLIRSS
jgi:hypothetical protein